jgi:hypothetical protein
MVSEQFLSKCKNVSKSASDNSQMVADLIRVRNRISTVRGWPQIINW